MPVDALVFALALEMSAGEASPLRAHRPAARPTQPALATGGDWQLLEFLGGWEAGIEPHLFEDAAGTPTAIETPSAQKKEAPP